MYPDEDPLDGSPEEDEIESQVEGHGEVEEDALGADDLAPGQEDDGREDEGQGGKPNQVGRSPGRANGAVRAARERAQAAEARVAELASQQQALQRQLAELQSTRSQAEEQERLALMSPEERAEYRIQKMQQQMERQSGMLQMQLQETSDRIAFEAKAAANKLYAQHSTEVERIVQTEKAQGRYVSREIALKYLLGEKLLAKQPAAQNRARRDAQRSQAQQRTTVTRPGGDVGANRARGQGKTAAERLKDVTF